MAASNRNLSQVMEASQVSSSSTSAVPRRRAASGGSWTVVVESDVGLIVIVMKGQTNKVSYDLGELGLIS